MSEDKPETVSLLSRPAVAVALAFVFAAIFGASLLQTLSSGTAAPLQIAIVALSGAGFVLTVTAACLALFRRRVRDLDALITVCAWTRRVQWQGRWISFEEYLSQRYDVRCTHGICDEAAEQLRKDAAKLIGG